MTATCHQLDHAAYCDAVASETRCLAEVVEGVDPSTPVPSCPEWALADLVRHVGSVQRWAATMVRDLTPERLPGRQVELNRPDDPAELPAWLAAGADLVAETFRRADPGAPMWAWGSDPHARFWPRRMLHETTVHRVDAELALGRSPAVDPAVAVDGLDELLDNLPGAAYFAPGVERLRGNGQRLVLVATDAGVGWEMTLLPDRFTWAHVDGGPGDATLRTTAADLLLVSYGRRPPSGPGVEVAGDEALLADWLAHSAL